MSQLNILAGPFNRPADDIAIATMITQLERDRRPFVLRDQSDKLATKKSRVIFVWANNVKSGRSKEDKGQITPKEIAIYRRQRNWKSIDWTLSNKELAAVLRIKPSSLCKPRRRFSPHTINPNLRRK